jgi:DNA-binding NtrC family response regulator
VKPFRSRVLVVDDDPALLTLLKAGLARWGFVVSTAGHGIDAMMQYRASEEEIVAIITDVDMPRMGGLEFIRAVREAGFKGRIVIMSGRLVTDELKAFQDCRVSGFFSKPFDISLLATMLSRTEESADDMD